MNVKEREELAREIVAMGMEAGASAAEVVIRAGEEFSAAVRLRELERLEEASFRKLGIRVFDGARAASSTTSDFSPETLRAMVADTLAMARAASPDPAAALPDPEPHARGAKKKAPPLAFASARELDSDAKIALALRCEEAALEADPRINNSEGAGFGDSLTELSYANSLGVCGSYARTVASLYATPLAEAEGRKQRDSWFTTHLDAARLDPPEAVGREAARRVLRRLGARKVSTCEVPVVFEPLAAGRLLSYLAEAVSGTSLVRKASFLLDRIGQRVASPEVTVVDDALLDGGLATRPFDSEGIASRTTTVIENGVLVSYLLDTYAARKLGLRSTGSSTRDLAGAPKSGPSNFFLKAGAVSPEEIIASVDRGLYVTELIGFGVNVVSGDYSQGAAGIWIEGGELAYPVEEITIAGNLQAMLSGIEAVGSDLRPLAETFAPTIKIGKMVLSGN